MKFVYKFYDMEDVEELYQLTKQAGINLSMKPLEVGFAQSFGYHWLLDPSWPQSSSGRNNQAQELGWTKAP